MDLARLRVCIALVALLLLAVPAADALDSSLTARSESYREQLADLPRMQNPDGGFGPLVATDNGTRVHTALTPEAALQTVLTAHLLLIEEADPYAVTRTYDGAEVSLAASNVSSALGWLRGYDAHNGTQLAPGELALVSIAYDGLGDPGNARRILITLLDREAQGATLSPLDAAQLLIADQIVAPATNATQNATLMRLGAAVNGTVHEDLEGTAWALIAQPEHEDRRARLLGLLEDGGPFTKRQHALAAWALAASGGPDDATEDALVRSYESQQTGLGRIYHMIAERTAYPAYSPQSSKPLFEYGMLDRVTGARDPRPSASVTQDAYDALLEENQALKERLADDDQAFPLPTWLMAGGLLFAMALVVVAGLAYGLKKEDLTGPRKELFEYIETHPGEHFSKIRRDLGMAPGTFQHHLSVLESEGWITSYRDSRYKRYFVNGNRYQKLIAGYTYKQKFAALANDTTRDFVRFVQTNPGVTQKQVAQRLRIHASTVNWHAKRLQQAGILQHERVGKEVRYTVDSDTVDKMLKNQREVEAAA